jgi:hypothetical protein
LGGLHDTYGRAREPGGPRCHARIWGNALVLDELELYILRVHLVCRDDKLPLAEAARENLDVKLGLELAFKLKLRGNRGFNVSPLSRGWLELHHVLNWRWSRLGLFHLLPLQLSPAPTRRRNSRASPCCCSASLCLWQRMPSKQGAFPSHAEPACLRRGKILAGRMPCSPLAHAPVGRAEDWQQRQSGPWRGPPPVQLVRSPRSTRLLRPWLWQQKSSFSPSTPPNNVRIFSAAIPLGPMRKRIITMARGSQGIFLPFMMERLMIGRALVVALVVLAGPAAGFVPHLPAMTASPGPRIPAAASFSCSGLSQDSPRRMIAPMPLHRPARLLTRSERATLLRASNDGSVNPPSFSFNPSLRMVMRASTLLKTIAGVLVITGVERGVAAVLASLGLSLPTAPIGEARLGT